MMLLDLLIPGAVGLAALLVAVVAWRLRHHRSPVTSTSVEALTEALGQAPLWVSFKARAWASDALQAPSAEGNEPLFVPLGPLSEGRPAAPRLFLQLSPFYDRPVDGAVVEVSGTWTECGLGGRSLGEQLNALKGRAQPAPDARALRQVNKSPEAWRREQLLFTGITAATLVGIAVLTITLMPDWMRAWIEAPYWPF